LTSQTKALDADAFQLSRVYGQGWNAAKKLLAEGRAVSAAQAVKLNPYSNVEERARWAKGFEEGLRSRTGGHNAARAATWRASAGE